MTEPTTAQYGTAHAIHQALDKATCDREDRFAHCPGCERIARALAAEATHISAPTTGTRTITLDGVPVVVPAALAEWANRQIEAVAALAFYAKRLEAQLRVSA